MLRLFLIDCLVWRINIKNSMHCIILKRIICLQICFPHSLSLRDFKGNVVFKHDYACINRLGIEYRGLLCNSYTSDNIK